MWVSEIQLKNVRQFEDTEFSFSQGFNLLVGGNGSGKSTLLHALFVSLGGKGASSSKRAAFSDDDIRLKSDQMSIETFVSKEDHFSKYLCHYQKHLRQRASRPSWLGDVPVVLYESNEALSKSLRSRSCRKVRFNNPSNQRATFDYLMAGIERGTFLPSDTVESSQGKIRRQQ